MFGSYTDAIKIIEELEKEIVETFHTPQFKNMADMILKLAIGRLEKANYLETLEFEKASKALIDAMEADGVKDAEQEALFNKEDKCKSTKSDIQ